jgi:hypothetical protein
MIRHCSSSEMSTSRWPVKSSESSLVGRFIGTLACLFFVIDLEVWKSSVYEFEVTQVFLPSDPSNGGPGKDQVQFKEDLETRVVASRALILLNASYIRAGRAAEGMDEVDFADTIR